MYKWGSVYGLEYLSHTCSRGVHQKSINQKYIFIDLVNIKPTINIKHAEQSTPHPDASAACISMILRLCTAIHIISEVTFTKNNRAPIPPPQKKQLWMFPQYLLIVIWHTHHYYSSREHDETVFSKPPSELWQGPVTTVAQRGFGQPAAGRPCCGGTTSCLSGGPPSSAQGPSVCILHHRLVLQNCQRKRDNPWGTSRNNFIYIL